MEAEDYWPLGSFQFIYGNGKHKYTGFTAEENVEQALRLKKES